MYTYLYIKVFIIRTCFWFIKAGKKIALTWEENDASSLSTNRLRLMIRCLHRMNRLSEINFGVPMRPLRANEWFSTRLLVTVRESDSRAIRENKIIEDWSTVERVTHWNAIENVNPRKAGEKNILFEVSLSIYVKLVPYVRKVITCTISHLVYRDNWKINTYISLPTQHSYIIIKAGNSIYLREQTCSLIRTCVNKALIYAS